MFPVNILNYFKLILEKTRSLLKEQIKKLNIMPDRGIDRAAMEEEADQEEEFVNQQSAAYTLKERLADIDSSLVNIKKGKYGICSKCGKQISAKILKIAPESKLCQDCKKKARKKTNNQ